MTSCLVFPPFSHLSSFLFLSFISRSKVPRKKSEKEKERSRAYIQSHIPRRVSITFLIAMEREDLTSRRIPRRVSHSEEEEEIDDVSQVIEAHDPETLSAFISDDEDLAQRFMPRV
jgi:hypothetical protein